MICYTAIFGKYDTLVDPPSTSIPLICFTDQRELRSRLWRVVLIDATWPTVDNRVRLARRYKLLAHEYLPNEGGWIWIDANLKLKTDPAKIADYLGGYDLATFRYPSTWGPRECLYDEAQACITRKKDDQKVISEQVKRYLKEGYPTKNGLVETSIIVRRNTEACRQFNHRWWLELRRGSRRDQISFPYVAWVLNFKYGIVPGCRINNDFAIWEPHQESIYR